VERVDLADPGLEQDLAFVAPVDLGLRAGHHLEPAMQPVQARLGVTVFGQPCAGPGDVELDPLVVPVEAVLGDERSWITLAFSRGSAANQASTTGANASILRVTHPRRDGALGGPDGASVDR